ncbi:MAG TPA: outer membrane beta-barrel protein [Bryobacteraceae bacterium]|nr:outer membrane beta-barrel protein [Bryobacteraceae bacterium]
MCRFLTVVGLSAAAASAQPFSAGVKVGLPLTDFVNTVSGESSTVTNRYLVGPTAELHLPFGLGIEVDALYRHFNYQNVIGSGLNALTSLNSTGAWEFPLLLKYRFHGELARPYVDAGVAWDTLSGLTTTVANSASNLTVVNPSGEHNSFTTGFVMGAGLDIHLVVHIMPELRYTRWTSQHFNISNVVNSNQNQAEFMVGVTF